jgi:hypothetical protein
LAIIPLRSRVNPRSLLRNDDRGRPTGQVQNPRDASDAGASPGLRLDPGEAFVLTVAALAIRSGPAPAERLAPFGCICYIIHVFILIQVDVTQLTSSCPKRDYTLQ